MLLTSSSISMTISSIIVFTFTTLLFFSGYALQRRTVHDIQRALNPPRSSPTAAILSSASPSATPSPLLRFDDPATRAKPRPRQVAYQEYLSSASGKRGSSRVAYARLVTEHIHLCDAVMFFAELWRARNTAGRVLLYPRVWDTMMPEEGENGVRSGSRIETSRRLLAMVAWRYGVLVLPVDPFLQDADPTDPASYPLPLLLSLTNYDRVLTLSPSGLLLDANSLDSLFDTPLETPLISFPSPSPHSKNTKPAIFLLHPSKSEHARLRHLIAANPSLSDPVTLLSHYTSSSQQTPDLMILQTSALLDDHTQRPELSLSTILASTAYVHIVSDPGPEYAVPLGQRERERLAERESGGGDEAGRIWEFVFERFREDRMRVCGLDLERWDGVVSSERAA